MTDVTNDLIARIEQRIEADTSLDDEVGLLIYAALEGDRELDDHLETGAGSHRPAPPAGASPDRPATGAFLRSVSVTGFRGIGPTTSLSLEPAPGLTVIAGRNGSGKSRLADGLEMVLTGDTYRWRNKKSTQWAEKWRNLHDPAEPELIVELVEQGSGPIRMRTTWPAAPSDVGQHITTAQRTLNGTKGPEQNAEVLGWRSALESFRPLLSYDELGGILEAGPSEL